VLAVMVVPDDRLRRWLFLFFVAWALLLVSLPAHAEGDLEPEPECIEDCAEAVIVLEEALPVLAVLAAAAVGIGLTRGRG
jgi:hypothetical protein